MDGEPRLEFTEEPAANRLLESNPLALMIGMLLDQQIQMEKAFRGPYDLQQRLGRSLDAKDMAALDPEHLESVFRERPALHRYPASMAKRTHALCAFIAERYDGRPERIWSEASDAADLLRRLQELPGFGKEKSRIFVGLLGKRLGIGPRGWEEVAADWPSIADVGSFADIEDLRFKKRARKERTTG